MIDLSRGHILEPSPKEPTLNGEELDKIKLGLLYLLQQDKDVIQFVCSIMDTRISAREAELIARYEEGLKEGA